MTTPAIWDVGLFDDSRWDVVITSVTGDITESPDSASGLAAIKVLVSGAVLENQDDALGIVISPSTVSGNIIEGEDVVYNVIQVKYAYRGGWAPQYNYKRDWEKEPELIVEETIAIELEPEAEFIPTPLPIDPAVARMIYSMMYGPTPIDTEEDDIEAVLMNL